jgi:hypothetical protein
MQGFVFFKIKNKDATPCAPKNSSQYPLGVQDEGENLRKADVKKIDLTPRLFDV